MNSLVPGIIGGACWFAGLTLDETTLIPIGATLSVMAGVWFLSARMQKQDDALAEIQRTIDELPCGVRKCKVEDKP